VGELCGLEDFDASIAGYVGELRFYEQRHAGGGQHYPTHRSSLDIWLRFVCRRLLQKNRFRYTLISVQFKFGVAKF
jgi:hypothetical protein